MNTISIKRQTGLLRFSKSFLICIGVLHLTACTSLAGRNQDQASTNNTGSQMTDAVDQCAQLMSDHKLDLIRNKIALTGIPDSTMQNNPAFVKANEKPAIEIWQGKRQTCRDAMSTAESQANLPPEDYTAISEARDETDKAIEALYQGKISWGNLAKAQAQIHNSLSVFLQNTANRYAAQYRAEDEQMAHARNAVMWNGVASAFNSGAASLSHNAEMASRPPVIPPSFNCSPNGVGGYYCN